jgi:hypothetical protein
MAGRNGATSSHKKSKGAEKKVAYAIFMNVRRSGINGPLEQYKRRSQKKCQREKREERQTTK